MSPTDFGYWLRGLMSANIEPAELGAYAIRKAAEISGVAPAPRNVPTMRALTVPSFCAHNVARVEECASCQKIAPRERTALFSLPIWVKQVYIPASTEDADGTRVRIADGGRGAGTEPGKTPAG